MCRFGFFATGNFDNVTSCLFVFMYRYSIRQVTVTRHLQTTSVTFKQHLIPSDNIRYLLRVVSLKSSSSTMASRLKEYRYYLSSGVSTGISVKISLVELAPALGCSVSGDAPKRAVSEAPLAGLEQLAGTSSEVRNSPVSEIFLTAQVFSDGLPLHPMVIRYALASLLSTLCSCFLLCPERYRS